MRDALPIVIGDDLSVTIAAALIRITPRQGMELAERLIRASTRRMLLEEAVNIRPPAAARSGTAKGARRRAG